MSLFEKIFLFFSGAKLISTDYYGNNYYILSEKDVFKRHVRYVQYKRRKNASSIPPLWSAWLRYSIDTEALKSLIDKKQPSFVKTHYPNLIGTNISYSPIQSDKEYKKKTSVYNAWIE